MLLAGQQLGPFVIEKELGSGAMGAVYRGIYTKTGQKVAIKIMAPGLGMETGAARFEREAAILKQFNHPNIVRLFGIGKHLGTRFYAMEYIEGESLDKIILRRGRLTWEEVVLLGQQLCAALQHSHERGVVHRDLKPSNLMILADDTLKLTDFGIAKDTEATALTSANCTVGTAAYMSPEQCRGERDINFKSDLYSLGVVFYELLTGKKPFEAENVMDLFLLHVQGQCERPSRLVLDIPIWLDTLVCQLMEKKPELRPLNAATVAEALETIQEKVEAQQSAGVEAARARMIDRPSGQRSADDTDRAAARTLLGKGKARKKKKGKKVYEQKWVQALGLLLLLGAVVTVIVLLLQPPSAGKLYEQARKLMESNNPEDWDRAVAVDGPIGKYLTAYAGRPGPETQQIRDWSDKVDLYHCDYQVANYLRKRRKNIKIEPNTDAERDVFKAAVTEDGGDLARAVEQWAEVEKQYGPGSGATRWGKLAVQRLELLHRVETRKKELDALAAELNLKGQEPGPSRDRQAQDALLAERLAHFGDKYTALRRFEDLKKHCLEENEGDPQQRVWYLLGSLKAWELRDVKEMDRKKLIEEKLTQSEAALARGGKPLAEARVTCQNLVSLYGRDKDLEPLVKRARDLLKQMESRGQPGVSTPRP